MPGWSLLRRPSFGQSAEEANSVKRIQQAGTKEKRKKIIKKKIVNGKLHPNNKRRR
jgi:hypothetical protein